MKYLKLFQTASEHENFVENGEMILPNVSWIVETSGVQFNPYIPPVPKAGDVVFIKDGSFGFVDYHDYSSSMGQPVGVVVVPRGFAPDGKVRIIGLRQAVNPGDTSKYNYYFEYSNADGTTIDTPLTNYPFIPITDNSSLIANGTAESGYCASDKFTGTASITDPDAKYNSSNNLIPSPYLNGKPNPEYFKGALSDFNGLANTQTLIGYGSGYRAAIGAWNYDDYYSNGAIQWYLPTAGELGFLAARYNEISEGIDYAWGNKLLYQNTSTFFSSTELSKDACYLLHLSNLRLASYWKYNSGQARAFAAIDL